MDIDERKVINQMDNSCKYMTYLDIIVLIFILISFKTEDVVMRELEKGIATCPSACKCDDKQMIAVCGPTPKRKMQLTYIPKLPDYIRSLRFVGNTLYHISRETLMNLTFITMQTIIFQNSKIRLIDPDAFQDLHQLRHLEINQNPVSPGNISRSLQSLNRTQIRILAFKFNFWKIVPANMLKGLIGSSVQSIFFDGNQFETFDGQFFAGLDSLKEVSFRSNKYLNTISLKGLPSTIEILVLSDNNFAKLPEFCVDNTPFLPALNYLNLDKNKLEDVKSSSFKCLHNLTRLSMNRNSLHRLRDNTFCHLTSLEVLSINEQQGFIKIIEPYAFNSSTLLRLSFGKNDFDFKRSDPDNVFKDCPNLRFLDLTNTEVRLGFSAFRSMFLPLRHLETLILQATQIKSLPPHLFPNMPSLQSLILRGNYITGWNDDPNFFGNITWMKELDLNGNNIRLVNKTSFPAEMLLSLRRLVLSSNDFTCSCELMWFRNWIRRNKTVVLSNWPQGYRCKHPPAMNGKYLQSYNPTEESCREPNPLIAIVIALSVVCGAAVVIVSILYKSRWHIRYWIYLLRAKKQGYNNINGRNMNFMFDGFVVYCEDDNDWVHGTLLPKLEQEHGYQLCIHDRDFDVGKLIVDNIVENMEQSRNVIVVLSNAFAKSDWCQFELRVSQNRFLKDQNVLVLIMLEEISNRNMSSTLKAMITTTTYAVWTQDGTGQTQFWDQLITALAN